MLDYRHGTSRPDPEAAPRTRRLRPCETPTASRPRSPKSDHPSRRPDRLTRFRPSHRRPPERNGRRASRQLPQQSPLALRRREPAVVPELGADEAFDRSIIRRDGQTLTGWSPSRRPPHHHAAAV